MKHHDTLAKNPQSRRTVVKVMAVAAAGAMGASAARAAPATRMVRVEDLSLKNILQGWGVPHKNRSVDNTPIIIAGRHFKRGIGTHAQSVFRIALHQQAEKFTAMVGLDATADNHGAVIFEVLADNKVVAQSPLMKGGDAARPITADLRGAHYMTLLVKIGPYGMDFCHADWADPVITLIANATKLPEAAARYEGADMVPQIASGDPPEPEFHGPRVVGATPGHDFLFLVPHTGQAPVTLTADGLPAGLTMTPAGVISGKIAAAGEYKVRLTAKNGLGAASRTLRLVAGEHQLAMTPPMGWNSWNAYGMDNSARRTMGSADAMISSGLAAKGFNYINIDDGWQNGRDAQGEILTTPKFGDMKKLADYVHSKGLRFGLYSSPGKMTCGQHTGSFGHEAQDAKTYARWGVDYLKYDWCSYGNEVPQNPSLQQYMHPYVVMRQALDAVDRDIFFSLCQYGMGHVWTWGGREPVWGNSYRISGDINDSWGSMMNNGFRSDRALFPFAGPGHWNDPDMLVVGFGSFEDGPLHWSKLTPGEQQTHITQWCMLAAPLLLGCNLEHLNKFTIDLMTNTEVLAINQDEIGVQAQCIDSDQTTGIEIWARPLWDGTVAVALYNLGLMPAKANIASWSILDMVLTPSQKVLRGKQPVRDLWQRKSLRERAGLAMKVPAHGAIMLKVGQPRMED
ncbi:MAG: alpha-galactosidase [Phycisphaerales bacterium]|nr:alpha-galactosidase [Phycisphaerales bacterium]